MKKRIIPNVSYVRLETHELLLRDIVRTEGYRTAINKVISPGDIVLDLGTGTGILAFFACQSGASYVYAIEREQILKLAILIAEHNGYQDRIEFIEGDSNYVDLPQQVDVLVSECLGSFGLNTMMINDFFQVRDRCLKPGGRVIPVSMTLFIAPFASKIISSEMGFWKTPKYGIDFSHIGDTFANNQVYLVQLEDHEFLASPQQIHSISFTSDNNVQRHCQLYFTIQSLGRMIGFCGWFDVELAPDIHISTSPDSPPTSWYQIMFPLNSPIDILPGDQVSLSLSNEYCSSMTIWQWEVNINRMGQRVISETHSSKEGFPKLAIGTAISYYPSF